jgi:hypothetical protein
VLKFWFTTFLKLIFCPQNWWLQATGAKIQKYLNLDTFESKLRVQSEKTKKK